MAPVFERMYSEAYVPFSERRLGFNEALDRGSGAAQGLHAAPDPRSPIWRCSPSIAKEPPLASPDQVPMKILVPAYVISELKTAFQIGFVVFIPFLIIDLVVSSVLMSMGMMMLSPVIISLPFKLMLFVLVDGWNLLVGSLVQSFYT